MFEGSFLGDKDKLQDDDMMECKICHYVYEPKKGDEYWQIVANTPFSELPDHWSCPECDGDKDQFMVFNENDS